MQEMTATELREMAADIESELQRLGRLEQEIAEVKAETLRPSPYGKLFTENLDFKLHNFYTGCERIFQIIASELNGSLPHGYDWHKRLLHRLGAERQGRPAVITEATVLLLEEFRGFRHVVRNLYGFEISQERLEKLVAKYPMVWRQFEKEMKIFITWLLSLADAFERDP